MQEFPKKHRTTARSTSDSILFLSEDEVLVSGCLFRFPLLICYPSLSLIAEPCLGECIMLRWVVDCLCSVTNFAGLHVIAASEYSGVYLLVWFFPNRKSTLVSASCSCVILLVQGIWFVDSSIACLNSTHVCPRSMLYRGRGLYSCTVWSCGFPWISTESRAEHARWFWLR